MDAKRCADRLVVHAHTATTSMPDHTTTLACPDLTVTLRCPDYVLVTQGTWPSALCHTGHKALMPGVTVPQWRR